MTNSRIQRVASENTLVVADINPPDHFRPTRYGKWCFHWYNVTTTGMFWYDFSEHRWELNNTTHYEGIMYAEHVRGIMGYPEIE
jgi:hypothetical protein